MSGPAPVDPVEPSEQIVSRVDVPAQLGAIVRSAGFPEESPSEQRAALFRLVEFNQTTYKVRAYPSAEAAERQLANLEKARDSFLPCYGRIGRFLVLGYVEGRAREVSDLVLESLGTFLGRLSAAEVDSARERFDAQLSVWLRDVERFRGFTPRTLELLRRHCNRTSGIASHWGLEYYDAMPRNFSVADRDRTVSIDEKHIHMGPRSVGLIKPKWKLPPSEFSRVLSAYRVRVTTPELDDPAYWEHLEFCYLVYSLATNLSQKPFEENLKTRAFHKRRRNLLRIVGAPPLLMIREQAGWLVLHALARSKMRLRKMVEVFRRRSRGSGSERGRWSQGSQSGSTSS
jgi:hypothetical protein